MQNTCESDLLYVNTVHLIVNVFPCAHGYTNTALTIATSQRSMGMHVVSDAAGHRCVSTAHGNISVYMMRVVANAKWLENDAWVLCPTYMNTALKSDTQPGIVTGSIMENETPRQACSREIMEELCLVCSNDALRARKMFCYNKRIWYVFSAHAQDVAVVGHVRHEKDVRQTKDSWKQKTVGILHGPREEVQKLAEDGNKACTGARTQKERIIESTALPVELIRKAYAWYLQNKKRKYISGIRSTA